jgi:hypothetical protein
MTPAEQKIILLARRQVAARDKLDHPTRWTQRRDQGMYEIACLFLEDAVRNYELEQKLETAARVQRQLR